MLDSIMGDTDSWFVVAIQSTGPYHLILKFSKINFNHNNSQTPWAKLEIQIQH